MSKNKRGILFLISIVVLAFFIYFFSNGLPRNSSVRVVLISSLIMLSFITFFLEHFFTKPSDVLASCISIILLLAPLKDLLDKFGVWYNLILIYSIILFFSSLIALFLLTKKESPNSTRNQWSKRLKNFSVRFGKGRFLFFLLFALTMLFYVDSQSWVFLTLFFYSAVILGIEPQKYAFELFEQDKEKPDEIGEIMSVESGNLFLAKVYPD